MERIGMERLKRNGMDGIGVKGNGPERNGRRGFTELTTDVGGHELFLKEENHDDWIAKDGKDYDAYEIAEGGENSED